MPGFECPNGHLVVGQMADPECPECAVPTPPRWKSDPYVLYHAEMADRRGLLVGRDLSQVQIAMVSARIIREREQDRQRSKAEFEKELMIHRPEAYAKIQQQLRMAELQAQAQWVRPRSVQEARELAQELEREARVALRSASPKPPVPVEKVESWTPPAAPITSPTEWRMSEEELTRLDQELTD